MKAEDYRTPWRRDYARLIHSAAFRRLQGKTQLFPNHESDFFRTRLTHSLEVAQVAKSIAIRLNAIVPEFQKDPIEADIVETAALAHDLGHPPFGHNGEKALDDCMKDDGGFEGNAQTLRILARLERRQTTFGPEDVPTPVNEKGQDCRAGLNLAYRTIAAILKYDYEIPQLSKDRKRTGVNKGYYKTERDIVKKIKKNIINDLKFKRPFKTIECSIMDIADDICYSTYDLEDAFKAGFLSPIRMISAKEELLGRVSQQVEKSLKETFPDLPAAETNFSEIDCVETLLSILGNIFNLEFSGINSEAIDSIETRAFISSSAARASDEIITNGYFRSEFTSHLVGKFIRGVNALIDKEHPPLSKVSLDTGAFKAVEVLKHFSYQALIMSSMLKVAEHRGQDIVKRIFNAIDSPSGHLLLPDDFQYIYANLDDASEKKRVICDFIAGMTDKYALEFHDRLYSATAETIFKPI